MLHAQQATAQQAQQLLTCLAPVVELALHLFAQANLRSGLLLGGGPLLEAVADGHLRDDHRLGVLQSLLEHAAQALKPALEP